MTKQSGKKRKDFASKIIVFVSHSCFDQVLLVFVLFFSVFGSLFVSLLLLGESCINKSSYVWVLFFLSCLPFFCFAFVRYFWRLFPPCVLASLHAHSIRLTMTLTSSKDNHHPVRTIIITSEKVKTLKKRCKYRTWDVRTFLWWKKNGRQQLRVGLFFFALLFCCCPVSTVFAHFLWSVHVNTKIASPPPTPDPTPTPWELVNLQDESKHLWPKQNCGRLWTFPIWIRHLWIAFTEFRSVEQFSLVMHSTLNF